MPKNGLIQGPSHEKGGIAIEVVETGQAKEVEGNEYVICEKARFSQKVHEFQNKTNKQILDEIHQYYNCEGFDPNLSADDFIICKLSVTDKTTRNISGTVAEILNSIQAQNGCITVPKEQYQADCHTCDHDKKQGGPIDNYLIVGQQFKDLGGHIVYIKSIEIDKNYPDLNTDIALWSDTNLRDWANIHESPKGMRELIANRELIPEMKQGGPVNPWAVCTTSIGKTAGTTKRSLWDEVSKKKYESCVLDVKEQMATGGPVSAELQDKIDKAKQLGELAFTNGLKAVPVHDADLMNIINKLKVGEGADKILKAWTDAWHRANHKANPVENFAPNKNIDTDIINKYPKLTKNAAQVVYNEVLKTIQRGAPYSESEKQDLERYEGRGSVVESGVIDEGMVHQFYTPYMVCKKMWDLAKHYGFNSGNILEPSSGTGRFFKFAPQNSTLFGFDLDETNIKIATALYPAATFYKQEFETAFLQPPNYSRAIKKSWLPEMDLVIGNPPYGDYEGYYKSYMPNTYKRFEFLFIRLGLQTLKPGGLLVFIISQNLMNNGAMYNKMKKDILDIGTFVDAIRLPNGIFTSTQIGTDIVIFRKK